VLDHQLSVQDDIDDKAVWSVRTAVIVVGLLLSAGSLGNVAQFVELPWYVHVLSGFGVSSLLLSIGLGIGTYTMTATYPGISHQRRIELLQGAYGDSEWHRRLLEDYQSWIAGQEAWNEQNGFYLFLTHASLLVGTTAIVAAGAISLFLTYQSYNGIALLAGLATPIAGGSLLLWRK